MGNRISTTAKQREELYVVGSIVWFADGKVTTQCLAEGRKVECDYLAGTEDHPLQDGDAIHPDRPARMVVMTKTEWLALISDATRIDRLVQ